MRQRLNPSLEVLQSSALLVLSLVSVFPKGGKKTPRSIEFILSSGMAVLIVSRWLYTRSIVIDGNFSAEHLKVKQPEDVALPPGGRYMVEPNRYELHLNTGKEVKQVSIYQEIYIQF